MVLQEEVRCIVTPQHCSFQEQAAGAMTATTAQMSGSDLGGADITGCEGVYTTNGIKAVVNQEETDGGINIDHKGIKGPLKNNMGSQSLTNYPQSHYRRPSSPLSGERIYTTTGDQDFRIRPNEELQ